MEIKVEKIYEIRRTYIGKRERVRERERELNCTDHMNEWHHDTHNNDTQHNDIQPNNTLHYYTHQNDILA